METEDKIEARDILDRVEFKLNYLTSSIPDEGLSLLLLDMQKEVKKVSELLQ